MVGVAELALHRQCSGSLANWIWNAPPASHKHSGKGGAFGCLVRQVQKAQATHCILSLSALYLKSCHCKLLEVVR